MLKEREKYSCMVHTGSNAHGKERRPCWMKATIWQIKADAGKAAAANVILSHPKKLFAATTRGEYFDSLQELSRAFDGFWRLLMAFVFLAGDMSQGNLLTWFHVFAKIFIPGNYSYEKWGPLCTCSMHCFKSTCLQAFCLYIYVPLVHHLHT